MPRVSISIDDARARRIIGDVDKGIADLSKPMSDIGQYLTGFFSGEVFASRGGVIGRRWAPLTDSYARFKAEQFPGRPPLVRTGVMQRSFRARAGRASVLLYNTDPKFAEHQEGTRRLPARVMMAVDEKRRIRARDILTDHLTGLAK